LPLSTQIERKAIPGFRSEGLGLINLGDLVLELGDSSEQIVLADIEVFLLLMLIPHLSPLIARLNPRQGILILGLPF
jgi:hypothetical protein